MFDLESVISLLQIPGICNNIILKYNILRKNRYLPQIHTKPENKSI